MEFTTNGIGPTMANRIYLLFFIMLAVILSIIYIFAWNMVLLLNFYIRYDLWTPVNIIFLILMSILSALSITMGIYSLNKGISIYKKTMGWLAVIPAFFTTVCPTCAPLLLSFFSVTFGVGMTISRFNIFVNSAIMVLLILTIIQLSSSIAGNCNLQKNERHIKRHECYNKACIPQAGY